MYQKFRDRQIHLSLNFMRQKKCAFISLLFLKSKITCEVYLKAPQVIFSTPTLISSVNLTQIQTFGSLF